jgi:hypothetical protein
MITVSLGQISSTEKIEVAVAFSLDYPIRSPSPFFELALLEVRIRP